MIFMYDFRTLSIGHVRLRENKLDEIPPVNRRIAEVRKSLNLKPTDVAKYLGIRRAAIYEIENGKRKVSLSELVRFSELTGYDISFFFSEGHFPVNPIHARSTGSSFTPGDRAALAKFRRLNSNYNALFQLAKSIGKDK